MRGSESPGPLELLVIDVDRDDGRRAGELGSGNGSIAHAAATEHGHGVAATHVAGVNRRTDAGHDAAAEQPGRRR